MDEHTVRFCSLADVFPRLLVAGFKGDIREDCPSALAETFARPLGSRLVLDIIINQSRLFLLSAICDGIYINLLLLLRCEYIIV